MIITTIENTGISGIAATFSLTDLVVLKGQANKLNVIMAKYGDNNLRKVNFLEELMPEVEKVIILLNKIVPEDIMSIEESHKALFTNPVEECGLQEAPSTKY